MRGIAKRLLARAPFGLVDFAKAMHGLIPDLWKYGKPYQDALLFLRESEQWSEDALIEYQGKRLRRLIQHSYTKVPYYRDLFARTGLIPSDITTVDDLQNIPCLTKELVRKHKRTLIASNVRRLHPEPELTSGSTGQPLDFLIDRAARAMERALVVRHLEWLGYEPGDVVAEIKSERFANPHQVSRYSPVLKLLRFGSFRVDDAKLAGIVRALQKYKPAFISSYPSSIYILTRWMERQRVQINPPKYVICSSEKLYPFIKERVQRILRCPVVDHYGQNEQVAYAFQCSEAKGYHVQMEQNIVELLPSAERQWEIVGTSLHNLAMPFIRYRTGDFAVRGEGSCPCGRGHTVIAEITGKHGDIIITPERNLISVVAMTYPFDHIEAIKEARIIQEDIQTLRVLIVPWDRLTEEVRELLTQKLCYFLGTRRMTIMIEEVSELPRTPGGKSPFIISHVSIEEQL
jgi:phenylacetate-CoA ligase